MQKIILNWSIILLVSIPIGFTQTKPSAAQQQTKILSLELSFGDKNLPSEYLLARPMGIYVNNTNNIYVLDEYRIKVYDQNGKAKTIFGGKGNGPGEFNLEPYIISSTPDGFLTIYDRSCLFHNVYTPNNSFVKKTYIRTNSILNDFISTNNFQLKKILKILCINENEQIIECILIDLSTVKEGIMFSGLIYLTNKNVSFITKKEILSFKLDKWSEFHWELIADKTIITSYFNCTINPPRTTLTEYSLEFIDFSGTVNSEIKHPYQPVVLSDSVRKKLTENIDELPKLSRGFDAGFGVKDAHKGAIKSLERILKLNQYTPMQQLKTDGGYIFIFTNRVNNKNEILTDVFDVKIKKYISSSYFPFIPLVIKNGYAYKFNDAGLTKDYPKVEKYKITPAVYGR